jgi:hypothetical protein
VINEEETYQYLQTTGLQMVRIAGEKTCEGKLRWATEKCKCDCCPRRSHRVALARTGGDCGEVQNDQRHRLPLIDQKGSRKMLYDQTSSESNHSDLRLIPTKYQFSGTHQVINMDSERTPKFER